MKPITIITICVICAATLMSGCVEDIARQTVHEGTFEVDALNSYSFTSRTTDDAEWIMEYEIRSSQPVTIYTMSRQNYIRKEAGLPSWYYISKVTNVYTISDSCTMSGDGVVLIENNNGISDARVYVKVDAVKW